MGCPMVSSAAAADIELVKSKLGDKCEVIVPVGLPEEGFFDWIDGFLAKNPDFMELSDRKIIDWASKSGIACQKKAGNSNDMPRWDFKLPLMDDQSVRRVISSIAPALRRNYVIGELKANLVAADREQTLQHFSSHRFKKTSVVLMGEPNKDYIDGVHKLLLAEKVEKQNQEKVKKDAE